MTFHSAIKVLPIIWFLNTSIHGRNISVVDFFQTFPMEITFGVDFYTNFNEKKSLIFVKVEVKRHSGSPTIK